MHTGSGEFSVSKLASNKQKKKLQTKVKEAFMRYQVSLKHESVETVLCKRRMVQKRSQMGNTALYNVAVGSGGANSP